MITPDALAAQLTLRAAVARYEQLRMRQALADPADPADDPEARPLSRQEALELLALGEVIARKAAQGRQLDVRAARAAGASWAQIGQALGTSRQAAWEAHLRWIDQQERIHGQPGELGLDAAEAARARALAGEPGHRAAGRAGRRRGDRPGGTAGDKAGSGPGEEGKTT